VAERAVEPVMGALAGKGIKRLILSPNRALHVFPLHACKLADGSYLADACEVVYTPSLSILHRCASRSRPRRQRLVLAENPTFDLPFTEVEAAGLRSLYPQHATLYGADARKESLLDKAASSHVLHYSGHATFDHTDPLASSLVLGDTRDSARWLTLREV